jgi:hypothetical protein
MKKWPLLRNTIYLVLILWLISSLSGCSSTKNLHSEQQLSDSSHESELKDSIELLKLEKEKLVSELRQSEYKNFQFYNDCDTASMFRYFQTVYSNPDMVHIPYNGNLDSLPINPPPNKVTYYPDGKVEVSGRLKSASFQSEMIMRTIHEKDLRIDSFAVALAKEKSNKHTETKTVTITKKVRFMPWWIWLLIPASALAWERIRKYIL